MVGFPHSILVQALEVDSPSRSSIFFGTHNHSMAPGHRLPYRDWFQYPKLHISVNASLHFRLPMDGNGDGGVIGNRFGI